MSNETNKVDGSYLTKKGDKLATYRYQITEFYVLIDGKKEELPIERIYSFKIEYYFDQAVFPIFKIKMVLEPTRYYNMIKNKKNVKFKVRIQMYYNVNDNKDEKSMYRDFINDTFVFFPYDDNSDLLKDARDGISDVNRLEKINNDVELFLFKDVVNKLRSKVNYIFTDIDMCTAVTYLLYTSGVKNVLMSPFDNTQIYPQLVLPPQSVESQIRYLNNNFGFHRKGSMIFFGFFHTYILDCKKGCTAWSKKEWKDSIIYILTKSNTKTAVDGSFIRAKEERFYTLVQADTVSISDCNTTTDVMGENRSLLASGTSNPFISDTLDAQYKSNGTIITMSVENINVEAFTPNKRHFIIFENTEHNKLYGGTYRLSDAIYVFGHGGADFIARAIFTFKKLK